MATKKSVGRQRTAGKQAAIGVDIGGTKVAVGLVNSVGEVLRTARRRMTPHENADTALNPVLEAIGEIIDAARQAGASDIGISVPGWVDSRQGVLLSATNLPCWRDYPLAEAIRSHFDLPTRLANDANVAALAEAVWGSGSAYRNVFYLSLGTGIGTGMVLDHRLYYGRTGAAGEGGHMTIDYSGPLCACGKRGCIEMYASGLSIARRARERLSEHGAARSKLFELVNGDMNAMTAQTVGAAALAGDELANQILRETAHYLTIWLGNIIDLLEPEVIVIGGGLGQLMREFVGYIREGLSIWAINPRRDQIPIRSALYGAESGLVGSAALCLARTHSWIAPAAVPRS